METAVCCNGRCPYWRMGYDWGYQIFLKKNFPPRSVVRCGYFLCVDMMTSKANNYGVRQNFSLLPPKPCRLTVSNPNPANNMESGKNCLYHPFEIFPWRKNWFLLDAGLYMLFLVLPVLRSHRCITDSPWMKPKILSLTFRFENVVYFHILVVVNIDICTKSFNFSRVIVHPIHINFQLAEYVFEKVNFLDLREKHFYVVFTFQDERKWLTPPFHNTYAPIAFLVKSKPVNPFSHLWRCRMTSNPKIRYYWLRT